jgi:hypothetical protein
MYSFLLLVFTGVQLLVLAGSYATGAAEIFYLVAVYGSPFYSIMTLLRADSAFFEQNPAYLAMFAYHLIKYFFFYLAQRREQMNGILVTAALLEAAYLGTSAYFLN